MHSLFCNTLFSSGRLFCGKFINGIIYVFDWYNIVLSQQGKSISLVQSPQTFVITENEDEKYLSHLCEISDILIVSNTIQHNLILEVFVAYAMLGIVC